MEELSIKEKAKRYDEALEKARSIRFGNPQSGTANTVCEEIFPELKESGDERIRKFLIKWIQDNYYYGTTEIPTKTLIAWLEKQVEQKPVEWSEEDERNLNTTIAYLKDAQEFKKTAEKCITWLKSLRPQNRWKPSDEQMEALKGVQEGIFRLGILESLYNDLMKLKE